MSTTEIFLRLCGWFGAILVLLAYFLVSFEKVKGDSASFQWMNIVGAAFLIAYTYFCEAYASVMVNTVWVIIGLRCVMFRKKVAEVVAETVEANDAIPSEEVVLVDGLDHRFTAGTPAPVEGLIDVVVDPSAVDEERSPES